MSPCRLDAHERCPPAERDDEIRLARVVCARTTRNGNMRETRHDPNNTCEASSVGIKTMADRIGFTISVRRELARNANMTPLTLQRLHPDPQPRLPASLRRPICRQEVPQGQLPHHRASDQLPDGSRPQQRQEADGRPHRCPRLRDRKFSPLADPESPPPNNMRLYRTRCARHVKQQHPPCLLT